MDIILRDIYYLRKLNFETRQLHVFSVRTGIAAFCPFSSLSQLLHNFLNEYKFHKRK